MLISQRPALTEETVAENRSRFVIEPLEPGFGYTLGNSLRRTLLSSIPGASVTSIRVDGVLHEFTTVPGVKEDITELILNLKELVVSSEDDEPVTMYLRKQGPGDVTAADIAPPAGVTVHNSDLKLATLTKKGKLEIELVVERGRGYVPASPNKVVGAEIGRIPVDSIYSPVLKVTYRVEATRVEQRTDFDRLVLDVETKPSISPRDALASAGTTLVELFGLARELNVDAEGIEIGPSPAEADHIAAFGLPIEEMDLTVRSYNCLKREGIHTVGELVSRTEADLLDIRNFGQKSIDEVKIKLAGMGLSLKDSPAGFDPAAAALAYSDNDWNDDTDDSSYGVVPPRTPRTTPITRRPSRSELGLMVHPVAGGRCGCSFDRRAAPNTDRKPSAPGSSLPGRRLTRSRPDRGQRSVRKYDMPTPPKGPRLGGSPAHERLILANLAQSLFEHGKITTTETKAKRLRPHAEKLITIAKKGTLHSRREVLKTIRDKDVVHKLFAEIAPSFATRDGGYTRIIKTAPRKGDNAPMAIIELVGEETVSASASRVARRAAVQPWRPQRPRCRVVRAATAAVADSATDAEDSPDRESGSVQAVEAGSEAPAEGADDASAEVVEPTRTDSATATRTAPDRESGSVQAVEAATEAPAEGADDSQVIPSTDERGRADGNVGPPPSCCPGPLIVEHRPARLEPMFHDRAASGA